jgi:FlaA1/EpsC-like NDP-sugar epimerase
MIRAKGMEPGREVEIVFTGLRPGEKLRDDLVGEGEELKPTSHPKVFSARGPSPCAPDDLLRYIAEMEISLHRTPEATVARLHELARLDLAEGKREAQQPRTSPGSHN